MIDKKLLIKHFSKNAANYDEYAVVQKVMAEDLMDVIKSRKINFEDNVQILEIGCGTGYFTKLLLSTFVNAQITAVDIAPGMIELAEKRIKEYSMLNQKTNTVEFVCDDIDTMEINRKYDLIVSNVTFQWLNNTYDTINKIMKSLTDEGVLCFSTLGEYTFNELHKSYKIAKRKLGINEEYVPSQKFLGFSEIMKNVSFEITGKEYLFSQYFDSVKEFLNSVKKIGANNSNAKKCNKSLILLKEMMNVYSELFREDNKIKATYHCMYFSLTEDKNTGKD